MTPPADLQSRLRTLLPDTYQDTLDTIKPVSMGSAGLKFGPDGKVAWDAIWGSFCDLAMAGGPPHRGTLLSPGSREDIARHPDLYSQVTTELCRGLHLVTGLHAEPSPTPGWVRLTCTSAAMSAWLTRAIVMENVSATSTGLSLYLPAGSHYRLEKEIKNVITVIAKTTHYWLDHTTYDRQQAIADLLRTMQQESPLLQPSASTPPQTHIVEAIHQATGLTPSAHQYPGWLGLICPDVPTAILLMRLLVASNALSRREATTVFIPLDSTNDPTGEIITRIVTQIYPNE